MCLNMKYYYFFVACFFGYLSTTDAVRVTVNPGCIDREKALSFLETADSFLKKARDSFPSCKEYVNSADESGCDKKESLAYIEISKKLISDARENFPKCAKPIDKDISIVALDDKPRDCSEILASGRNESGIYTIWPGESCRIRKPLKVYCDMDTEYGGWTVIQRRGKFPIQQDFYLSWESYKNGFGNLSQEFWLGNENIRVLCQEGCEIRFDLEDDAGQKAFALYQSFRLSKSNYLIEISGFSGTAGDSMSQHNKLSFNTKDKGDTVKANVHQSGWWHRVNGYYSNLNGRYETGKLATDVVGWHTWRDQRNLKATEMKVRPN